MNRMDQGLAFLLRYENVAWYADGKVTILDRRIYPTEIEFVTCTHYLEVVQAIKDLVTQSAGPYTAIGMGMALAAYSCRNQSQSEQIKYLTKAADDFSNARVTTKNRYAEIANGCLYAAKQALTQEGDCVQAIVNGTIESLNRRYSIMQQVAQHLVARLPQQSNVLTQCFGETIVAMMCRVAKLQNKNIHFYHAETRPFLQGARLSASVCSEMGMEATVICDNMVAYTLQNKNITMFTSAADTIAMDGSIANKIGTFQIAILAKHFNVPYYVTGIPDLDKQDSTQIVIEERDPQAILAWHNKKHTLDGVKGLYPSFDITPAAFINGIVTPYGVYKADALKEYTKEKNIKFY